MQIFGKIIPVVVLILLSQRASPAQPPDSPASAGSESYVWRNVTIGGGGFVTGIIFHPHQKGLLYARTDVGGAYRSEDSGKHWTPITDWIAGADLTGIESLAVDPADANRVYLAAGIYPLTRAAILRSADRGNTWQETEVPFKMGGNAPGRFDGERLAVDPHDGKILFFGSRQDGLWRSGDSGATWNKVETFPPIDTAEARPPMTRTNLWRHRFNFRPVQIGIVFVQFDPRSDVTGQPTPVLYAGVSSAQTNFFRSNDGGKTWAPVPAQPMGLRPSHAALSPDGTLYLTYGKEAGPGDMTDGAVWKFIPQTGAWTDITPLKPSDSGQPFGYGAIAVDAQNPSAIVVTTFDHWKPHDEIFRSTNAGASWMPLLQTARWDHSGAPYTKGRTPHWMGGIQIDPFDSNHVLFTTGYGIWSSDNLTGADAGRPTRWNFSDAGLEETVPLALISPPAGAHLLSGVGDIDGFRHDNLNASPAHGTFAGPHFANTEDLAFAGKKPSIIVRTGTGGNGVHAAISTNGGKNWTALRGEPPGRGAGTIAISADGTTIVWTMNQGTTDFSTDCGAHWTACAGPAPGLRVIADPVNPSCFYSFDARTGKVLASTNGAESFSETCAVLPDEDRFGHGGDDSLSASPGVEGDLWLAFGDHGLYHSTNGGASFTNIGTVDDASSLGLGKPAAGKTSPALYLAGTVGNVEGLFRSVDAGATWTRINDDRHQFGVISHVTGDPRIFGRVYFATGGRGVIYGDDLE